MLSHMIFKDASVPKNIAILVPQKDFNEQLIRNNYVSQLVSAGIPEENIIACNLEFSLNGKITVTAAREYLEKLKPILESAGVKDIFCCDSSYFKALTRATKVDPYISYRMDTIWPMFNAFYCPTFRRVIFDVTIKDKISMAAAGLASHIRGLGNKFDDSILWDARYPDVPADIRTAILDLLQHDTLTCDIETYGLHLPDEKITMLGTIAFAWNMHAGVAFSVGYPEWRGACNVTKKWLKQFFIAYAAKGGKLIFHNATFDIKMLIWELFMKGPDDIKGMLHGLKVMFLLLEDDTKVLAYLATNTAGGNKLDLKSLAFAYTGNYALDMTDIIQHTPEQVLLYNLMDACATWYVRDKYREVVRNTTEFAYQTVFRPSLKTITQMELTGIPLNLGQVLNAEIELEDIRNAAMDGLLNHPTIIKFTELLRDLHAQKATAKLKKLVKTAADYEDMEFNPNSPQQVSLLLYQEFKLPVISKTDNKNPSVDTKTLKALKKHEENSKHPRIDVIEIISYLQQHTEVDILLNTFIPAFKSKTITRDGWKFLLGNFNLGGTKSGRLSSSDPNLQNIPATGSKFAKTIKKCFQAPPKLKDPYGSLFVGADFFSLEDRISALLSKDPNKLKVYTDGFDGHCLRAYSYFFLQMLDITERLRKATTGAEEATIINSIENLYPDLRQRSKGPTFALTYMGTHKTLVKTFGFNKAEALQIEKNYHNLYSVSDEWVKDQIRFANQHGYIELAFGVRLYTPLLPQIVLTSYDSLPFEAYKEIKTAGNALGQSYGLLNSHSGNQFMERVWSHPKYSTWILPCAQIHDSQYYWIRNHLGCVQWVNDNLIECMEWADLEPIRHPTVGLGAKLAVYYPDWNNPIHLPNKASSEEILRILSEGKLNLRK